MPRNKTVLGLTLFGGGMMIFVPAFMAAYERAMTWLMTSPLMFNIMCAVHPILPDSGSAIANIVRKFGGP